MHDITIIDTHQLVEDFERTLGQEMGQEDRLELFKQLFFLLDEHTPLDLYDRNILTYESFIFSNYVTFDKTVLDQQAYHLLVLLWRECQQRHWYRNGKLQYMPFAVQGSDLCVRYYKN